ncbi:hypothetical protein [Streptomyces sp. SJL17-1]|uniref:hypothetical protein n=1 Tax=Streptomyces sp. SJL17-1 TaxID=2967223 RepID=UPI0029666862|nr:hypothetical protein [Streptomyces sp. SJL17-1]
MFEIRIICDPDDTDRVIDTLSSAFTTWSTHRVATRDGDRNRIYLSADHRPATTEEWPTPEQAYATAPSIISEIGWVARTAGDRPFGTETSREFWLRKAALLDRIALGDHVAPPISDATEDADRAARRLMEFDSTAVICDPRHYARQQYTRWLTHNQ